jgi:hypothetical protein
MKIWRYIPEDRTLHNHSCENLRYYIWQVNKKEWGMAIKPDLLNARQSRRLARPPRLM